MQGYLGFGVLRQSSPSMGVVGGPLPSSSRAWLPSDYGSTITMGIDDYASGAPADGTALATLTDRWGGGVNATAGSNKPTYKTGAFGSGGAFQFAGTSTDEVYAVPGAPLQATHTWIAVVKWTAVAGNDYSACGNYTDAAMSGPGNPALANVHFRTSKFASYPAQGGSGISFDTTDNGGHTLDAWHVVVLPFNMTGGGSSTMRIDGYSYPLGGTFSSFPGTIVRILMMGTGTGRSTGYLRSMFLIPALLDQDTIEKFEGYYANLGGFNANLNPTHPYVSSAPTV